jgi:hypothetical protein
MRRGGILKLIVLIAMVLITLLLKYIIPQYLPTAYLDRIAASPNALDLSSRKRVLIGFFCTAGDLERRMLIRSILYERYDQSRIDVRFVIGGNESDRLLLLEHNLHRDLFRLTHIKENMEEGKTFTFFKAVHDLQREGILPVYDFVMKSDIDTFVHPTNLLNRLQAIPQKRVYSGCMVQNYGITYATGMAYLVSGDLVSEIATSQYAFENSIGYEDVQTGKWIHHFAFQLSGSVHYVNDWDRFRDHPLSGAGFAKPFYPAAIAVHWLKSSDVYIETALHYSPDLFQWL